MSTQDHTNTRPLIETTIAYCRARRDLNDIVDVAIAQLYLHAAQRNVQVTGQDKHTWRLQLLDGTHPMRIAWQIEDTVRYSDSMDEDDVRSATYR